MIVYRIGKKEEIKTILNEKSFINTGYKFSKTELNTHEYNDSINYLHFFKDLDSIFCLRTLTNRYLCIYDIPDKILLNCLGMGYYADYFNYKDIRKIREYAINVKQIQFEYLKEINYIKEFIDIDDYFYYNNLNEKLISIYKRGDHKKLTLKHKNIDF